MGDGIAPERELDFSPPAARSPDRAVRLLSGFSIEHVRLPETAFDYRVLGNNSYLALHDIELQDGEVALADGSRSHTRLLSGRLTFVPRGCQVTGWSNPSKRRNSFTALYFDAASLADELRVNFAETDQKPSVYFRNAALEATLRKLETAVTKRSGSAHLESLCLVAMEELLQASSPSFTGRLNPAQLNRLLDYVEANLADDISVGDMAAVLGLSRFHFSRMYKAATLETPYQFLLRRRVERSKNFLQSSTLSISEIAQRCGFRTVTQFEDAFGRIVGVRPRTFRSHQIICDSRGI
jgi:AraC family transcriptional regulator